MSERTTIRLLKVLFFPFYLPMLFTEEISGEGRWYRRQRRRMLIERPPLPDAEYLRAGCLSATDAPLWLAVRRVMAESCGLPSEAIHPRDRIADLGRMQWIGLDSLDFIFRLERLLGKKIKRATFERGFLDGWPDEFGQFAACVVCSLREPQQDVSA